LTPYTLIENTSQLEDCYQQLKDVDWITFDTEFVGEKRYTTLICLIQVGSPKGNFLIDPLKVQDLAPFFELIANPGILKITHAGENDYRLLHQQFGILPKHVFDTQMAAGLLGYRYPSGLGKIVSGELKIQLRKGFAVTDWEARPFTKRQLDYALEDVVILEPLWRSLTTKLKAVGRMDWAQEECRRMQDANYYYQDPHHEALTSNLITNLKRKEQVFLIRLFAWRRSEAERQDYSKNMILPSKLISQIVKGMRGGLRGLQDNRRIPDRTVKRFGHSFVEMYEAPPTDEELSIIKRLPTPPDEDARDEILLSLLYLLMKYRCQEEGISHSLVMPRSAIRNMKNDPAVLESTLGNGWRRQLLGNDFVRWLEHYDHLDLRIEGGQIAITVDGKK
jgi:ribonuclease D